MEVGEALNPVTHSPVTMGATRRVGATTALVLLGLAALCAAEEPEHRCFEFGNSPFPATIKPVGDITLKVGSSYEAYCLFNPDYVKVDDVYFLHWDDDAKYKIPHQVVNNSAIKVTVPNPEMADYKLKCEMTYKNETKFLCERTVKIGYEPQDVQNLTCISRNWQQLNCTWVQPPNPVRVKYNLTYVVADFRDTSPCPKNQNGKVNWCYWKDSEFDHRNKWILTFTAQNALKSGVEFKHDINVWESVIPKPAENFAAYAAGPDSVNLTWELPHPMDTFPGKVWQEVSYREHPEGTPPEELEWMMAPPGPDLVKPPLFEKLVYKKTIEGLYAYMQYDFRVRLHTGAGDIREHMWSDAAVTTCKTDPKLPTEKVRTDIGLFEIEQNVNVRDIYVNWQRLDSVFKNGPDFHYHVEVFDDNSGEVLTKDQSEVEIHDDYAKFMNMENSLRFRFEIRPVNSVGKGGNETMSTVIVPEKNAVLSFPRRFQVIAYNEKNSTTYGVKWNITEEQMQKQKIESVSIYWCKKKAYEDRCMEKIDWINVNPLLPIKNITDLKEEPLYNFGISVNSNKSSSGIKWISCIANHGSKLPPIDKFEGVALSPTDVELKWNLDCRSRSVDTTGFNISYCVLDLKKTDCSKNSDVQYIAVEDGSACQLNVSSLHPFTDYVFSIASETEFGISRWSKSLHLKTKEGVPSGKPQNISIIGSSENWIRLEWKQPEQHERNGIIRAYKVTSEPAVVPWSIKANNDSEVIVYDFTGLEAYTDYKFMIFACTGINSNCGNNPATITVKTDVGVPGPVEGIYVNDDRLQWNLDDCNGKTCFFEIHYGTNKSYNSSKGQTAVNLQDLNINCTEYKGKIDVKIRAVSEFNKQGKRLTGDWKQETVNCPLPGIMAWWLILLIACVCIIATVILVAIGSFGRTKIKKFLLDCNRELELPPGLGPNSPAHDDRDYTMVQSQVIDSCYKTRIPSKNPPFSNPEEQELIPDKARQSRNPSGDSGTSENDPVDSSGCSTGSESDSSSGSHRVPQSSDSGTGTEVGFPPESKNWESGLRLRTPAPPYVRPGLPQNITSAGYVSVSSVPNLPVGSMEDGLSLQQSTSSLALGTPSHQPLVTRRASTGYISMPDQDSEGVNVPLEMLGNVTLPHDSRQGGFPAYSRHNFSLKKTPTEMSPYMKTGSLQRLNTGYVAVAQPDGGSRDAMSQAHGYYVEDFGSIKRQASLSALPLTNNKSISTPDEDLPPGTYCRVGARGSPGPAPGPPPGYVSITQAMPSHIMPHPVTTTSPTNKSQYVTLAMAKSIPSPTKEPEKVGSGGYVSVGDMAEGRWAHPVMTPEDFEESREVSSAPVEGTRSRPTLPLRPDTTGATVQNRGASRLPSLAPSLSKQSSGYVSQDSLPFHDPVVMSPKRLLTQSKEPYSVIMPPEHKGTAV